MKPLVLVLSILAFSATLSASDLTITHKKPPHKKPIDALCFYTEEGEQTIHLNHCGIKNTKYVFNGQNANFSKQGFIGYDWKDPEHSIQGYSYYKYFKAAKAHYWLFTVNNDGGNAETTSLYWLKKMNEDTVHLKRVFSGNRCNKGIESLAYKKKQLRLRVHITAYDFVALSKAFNPSIKAYDDLASCAVCCVATAVYELQNNGKMRFNSIDLSKSGSLSEMPTQGRYQATFNHLLSAYIAKGKTELNQEELDEWVKRFNQRMKN